MSFALKAALLASSWTSTFFQAFLIRLSIFLSCLFLKETDWPNTQHLKSSKTKKGKKVISSTVQRFIAEFNTSIPLIYHEATNVINFSSVLVNNLEERAPCLTPF